MASSLGGLEAAGGDVLALGAAGWAAGEAPRRLLRRELQPQHSVYSLAALGGGRVTAGFSDGSIAFHDLSGADLCSHTKLRLPDVW